MSYFFEMVRLQRLVVNKRPIEEIAYELDYQDGIGGLDHMAHKGMLVSIMNQLEDKGTLSEKQELMLRKAHAFNTIYHQMY